MKILDVMTSSPELCTTNDTVVECAQLMAQRDIGIVPICESQDTRRLLGCVTDRDIALRVVAEQRDYSTPVGEIMSSNLVTVRPDDEVQHVRELMEEHQIRRVMVVDEFGSLIGIIATADLARTIEETAVGETLEAISQPAPTLNIK